MTTSLDLSKPEEDSSFVEKDTNEGKLEGQDNTEWSPPSADEEDPSRELLRSNDPNAERAPEDALVSSFSPAKLYSKLTWNELSGACGDFGDLFPLVVALAQQRKIHLAPTFFVTGICHILTGWYWDVPMPLQPMDMISAQALSGALESPTQVAAAGVGMGACFLILQFGGIEWLQRIIPKSVVGGLQLGVGWKVALKGISMIQKNLPWWGQMDCIAFAIAVSVCTLYGLRRPSMGQEDTMSACRRFIREPPVGLYLSALGLLLAILQLFVINDGSTASNSDLHLKPEPLLLRALKHATGKDWSTGLTSGTLPQLPLTALNSCLSVCLLAETFFPVKGTKVSRKSVCLSIGLINIIGSPLGMFPHCHGAGGLAGQYKLGARSGVSMMGLGIFKICLSLWALQGSLLVLLDALPLSVLGVFLALAGHELAVTGIKTVFAQYGSSILDEQPLMRRNQDMGIALITALVIVGTGMAHVGTLCGWVAYMIYGNGVTELFGGCCKKREEEDGEEGRGEYSQGAASAKD